jgi:hypothetical protein
MHSRGRREVRQMAMHTSIGADQFAMTKPLGMTLPLVIALSAAIWIPLNAICSALGWQPNDAWSLWYLVGYPFILLLLFGIGYRNRSSSSILACASIVASYASALYLVPHTGTLFPFEVLVMCALAIPAALASRMGARLGNAKLAKRPNSTS